MHRFNRNQYGHIRNKHYVVISSNKNFSSGVYEGDVTQAPPGMNGISPLCHPAKDIALSMSFVCVAFVKHPARRYTHTFLHNI